MADKYTVWVGGVEVNNFLMLKKDAIELANLYRNLGYEDVHIEKYRNIPYQVELYLWQEFAKNNIPKYYKYFEQWVSNLTNEQIVYFIAYYDGHKTTITNFVPL